MIKHHIPDNNDSVSAKLAIASFSALLAIIAGFGIKILTTPEAQNPDKQKNTAPVNPETPSPVIDKAIATSAEYLNRSSIEDTRRTLKHIFGENYQEGRHFDFRLSTDNSAFSITFYADAPAYEAEEKISNLADKKGLIRPFTTVDYFQIHDKDRPELTGKYPFHMSFGLHNGTNKKAFYELIAESMPHIDESLGFETETRRSLPQQGKGR